MIVDYKIILQKYTNIIFCQAYVDFACNFFAF